MTSAILYDGQSADRHIVSLSVAAGAIRMEGDTVALETLDPDMLRAESGDGNDGNMRVSHDGRDGWRLIIPEPIDEGLRALLPDPPRYGGWVDKVGVPKAAGLFAGIAAVVLLAGYTAPRWIAPLVPESWEENVGTALIGDLGDSRCESEEAEEVLEAMVAKLDPDFGTARMAVKPSIVDIPIFNAAALPGGHIVIFDGALDRDVDGDALAGIIAHEIAHVRERHVAQALVREFGIGALIRLFGGDIGATAQQIVALSYTRGNESEADAEAIKMLDAANISPLPTSDLFDKFSGSDDESMTFLDSHPLSGNRAEEFEAAYDKDRDYTPAFTKGEMATLRRACGRRKLTDDTPKTDQADGGNDG